MENKLLFDEATHTYSFNGKKLISVTQLMQKHGLAPSYAGVSSEVLEKKAAFGTLIHKEIETYNKTGELGFTPEVFNYSDYVEKNNVQVFESELQLHNDIVAGTCDLILNQNNEPIIADIKTTYTLHKESVSWQLSIYLYLYGAKDYSNWKGQAFHFNRDGELNVVNIPLKPYEEVEKLMDCERNGEIYKRELTTIGVDLSTIQELEEIIRYHDNLKKEAEKKSQELKDALVNALEKNGITQYENESLKITYVAPQTRITLDSKAIKEKYPEIYDENIKTTNVKASVRITLKEAKDD